MSPVWLPDPDRPGYEYFYFANGVARRRTPGGSTMGTQAAPNVVKLDDVEIERMFTSHIPNDWQVQAMNSTRIEFKNLAKFILKTVPNGRERALVITHLEKASMYANAGIVRPKLADVNPGVSKDLNDYVTKQTSGGIPVDRSGDVSQARGSTDAR